LKALNEEMGYDATLKIKISQEALNEAKSTVINLTNFIDRNDDPEVEDFKM
jgi:hypothetical protein